MFVINDNDLPIVVAQKIIRGTKPSHFGEPVKKLAKAITGDEEAGETQDMFDLEEIKEIADYLMVYYNSHPKGD